MIFEKPIRYEKANLDNNEFSQELMPAVHYLRDYNKQKTNLIIQGDVGSGKTWLIWAFLDWLNNKDQHERSLFKEDEGGMVKTEKGSYYRPPVYYESLMKDVSYYTLKEIIEKIKGEWNTDNQGYFISWLKKTKLLIIDEIGVNYGSDSERIELFELFNYRWENMLPTICLSNSKKIEKKDERGKVKPSIMSILGQRITDRLFDNATYIELTGKSMRG